MTAFQHPHALAWVSFLRGCRCSSTSPHPSLYELLCCIIVSWSWLQGCSWPQDGSPSSMGLVATSGRGQWPPHHPWEGRKEEEFHAFFHSQLCDHRGVGNFSNRASQSVNHQSLQELALLAIGEILRNFSLRSSTVASLPSVKARLC